MSEPEGITGILEQEGERRHPTLTGRWLRAAASAARSAFEREMRRERRSLDAEFDRFWRERGARQA